MNDNNTVHSPSSVYAINLDYCQKLQIGYKYKSRRLFSSIWIFPLFIFCIFFTHKTLFTLLPGTPAWISGDNTHPLDPLHIISHNLDHIFPVLALRIKSDNNPPTEIPRESETEKSDFPHRGFCRLLSLANWAHNV